MEADVKVARRPKVLIRIDNILELQIQDLDEILKGKYSFI